MSPQTPRIGDRGPDVRMKAKPVVITFPADRRHTANSTTAHCRATEADQIAATGNSSFAKTDDCGEKTSAGVLHRPPKGRGGLGDLSRGDDIQRQAPQENTQAEKATPFSRNGSFYCVALERGDDVWETRYSNSELCNSAGPERCRPRRLGSETEVQT